MLVEKTITNKYNWIIWLKALVFMACALLIYLKLKDSDHFGNDFFDQTLIRLKGSLFIMVFVIFLMPVNWLLEALKWRLLARPITSLSISDSIKGVVAGLSLGFITPNAIGDYAGRLMSVDGESKGQLLGNIWLGRAMQMAVTLTFGLYGVVIFFNKSSIQFPNLEYWWIVGLTAIILVGILLFQSKFKIFGQRVAYYFTSLKALKLADYVKLFLLSSGRYLVFSFQYLLILRMFDIPLPNEILFAGISWMFLVKSVIPSFNFLSDLGVRELSVLTFFDSFEVSQPGILSSSLLLWLINILIPVVIGMYFVLKMKIIDKP